jgi:hypothetical protein
MEIAEASGKIVKTIEDYFKKETKKTRRNIALCVYGILRGEKVNTAEIARHMTEVNGHDFKTNDMRIYRLLQSKNFQVSDATWRGYIRLLFDLLRESGLKKGQNISINVDFTSDRNDFLILCGSVYFQGESIPVYFSMRRYPNKRGMSDQKKLEEAFFKELKHLLPDSFTYTIVSDRGFGNSRIISILENIGFTYVIRLNDSFRIRVNETEKKISDLPHKNMRIPAAYVLAWKREIHLVKKVQDQAHWILAASPTIQNPGQIYARRFTIERMFKNEKSAGFDLEKLLINKYDRFKRMLFISCIAYTVMIFVGLFIHNKAHAIKKNYFLHLDLLSVFSA